MIILDLLYSANFVLKKRNVPIQKQKRKTKKKLIKSFKKSFFDIEILKTFFLFLYFKQKRNETKFFFRGAIKNELFDHKKNETLTSLDRSNRRIFLTGKRFFSDQYRTGKYHSCLQKLNMAWKLITYLKRLPGAGIASCEEYISMILWCFLICVLSIVGHRYF